VERRSSKRAHKEKGKTSKNLATKFTLLKIKHSTQDISFFCGDKSERVEISSMSSMYTSLERWAMHLFPIVAILSVRMRRDMRNGKNMCVKGKK
jgi:hypothetical protein